MTEKKKLTTNAGAPVADNQNTMTAGPRGPALLQDDDSQPGLLFRLMIAEQKQVLFENTARAMGDAPKEIKIRHIGNCMKADPAYGKGVAKALGISMNQVLKNK